MKEKSGMNVFGIINIVLLSHVNPIHALWTYWLTAEQVETGWGHGTNMELAVLYPWLIELLCAPAMIAAAVYLIMSCFLRHKKGIVIANIVLFAFAAAQFILTNLFIFF